MYIHYVYNASLCVVYFISCITLCYCTPTLNILIKLARDIILYSFLAYNTYISLFQHTSPHTNETNYVCSIASLIGDLSIKNFTKIALPHLSTFPWYSPLRVPVARCSRHKGSTQAQRLYSHQQRIRCQDFTSATSTAAT